MDRYPKAMDTMRVPVTVPGAPAKQGQDFHIDSTLSSKYVTTSFGCPTIMSHGSHGRTNVRAIRESWRGLYA
jgi:hypothetical protein